MLTIRSLVSRQIILVTNRLGWDLLSVYTVNCRKMSYQRQKEWMRTYRWTIFGYASACFHAPRHGMLSATRSMCCRFTLPFALVTVIPFVGPLLLGLAEAASAHLVSYLVGHDLGHQAWRNECLSAKLAADKEEIQIVEAQAKDDLTSSHTPYSSC